MRYTVVLCTFKVFEINHTVNLRRASATMASLPLHIGMKLFDYTKLGHST